MKVKIYLSVFVLFCCSASEISAQANFALVKQILQTNCAGSYCHGASHPSFDVTVSDAVLYNKLISSTPVNPVAAAKGDKLVTPGYAERSFLLRKLAHGLNENNAHLRLDSLEGDNMPAGGAPALAKTEIEVIRQWILHGAPLTANVIDTATINKYYSGKGKDDTYVSHAPPAPGTGFQIYVGKLLIPANSEPYIYIKHDLRLSSPIEIPQIATMLAASTHHFVIFKFQQGGASNYADGIRYGEDNSSHADVADGIGTGPNLWQYDLPANTAYFWEQSTILDFNLHIRNGLMDTVLGTDIYINVYTEPLGTAQKFMLIRNFPVFTIAVPPDSLEHEFVEVANDTNETHYWNVWQLYGHTHQYGTDYDIFTRNQDGSMGEQQYESWISYEAGMVGGQWVNVGFHRYGVDATFRFYPDDSLLVIDPRLGFIHRARYRNNTTDTIYWGVTSEEEMMVMGFQFVYGDELTPLSVEDDQAASVKLNVFPNPASEAVSLNYILPQATDVTVELTNVLGEIVTLMKEESKQAGNYLDEIELNRQYPPGVYLLSFSTKYSSTVKRIVIE